MRKIVEQGETLRLYLSYTDVDTGEPVDPLALTCTTQKPDGSTAVLTYPHANFVREAMGEFFIRVLCDAAGTWRYRVYAETSVLDKDVREGKFDVEPVL